MEITKKEAQPRSAHAVSIDINAFSLSPPPHPPTPWFPFLFVPCPGFQMLEYVEEDWKSRFVLSPVSVVLHICSPSRTYFLATVINVSRLARVVLMFSQPNSLKLYYDYIVLFKAQSPKKKQTDFV